MLTSCLRSERESICYTRHWCSVLPYFSTFYLFSIHLSCISTELNLSWCVYSFTDHLALLNWIPHGMGTPVLDLCNGDAQGWEWCKPADWCMFLTHCITMTNTSFWIPFHFSLLMAMNNLMWALGYHLFPNWCACHVECGLYYSIEFLHQKYWQGALLCWFSFFFSLTLLNFTFPCSS